MLAIRGVIPIVLTFLVLVLGCEPRSQDEFADKIEIISGNNQTGKPGDVLGEPLVVRVLGPRRIDFLGRKRERQPAEGVLVTFGEQDDKKTKDETADNTSPEPQPNETAKLPTRPTLFKAKEPPEVIEAGKTRGLGQATEIVKTDAAGLAKVDVRLGRLTGDWRITASVKPKGKKKEDVHFRVTNGVETLIGEREGPVGTDLPIEIRLYAWSADKNEPVPIENREVFFSIIDEPQGAAGTAELRNRRDKTKKQGERDTTITLGDEAGIYRVLAEMTPVEKDDKSPNAAGESDKPWRGVVVTVVATDWLVFGVQFLAGLLLFFIGVRLLGSGVLLLTSRHMHLPTGPWSRNRFNGFIGGTVAGGLFESSSAVISHLTSLSNSGLITAASALGLILGANVGGTLLCQILALDLPLLSAPLLVVGTLLLLARKRWQLGSWAWIFVGSGLVFFSWNTLDQALGAAALSQHFREIISESFPPGSGMTAYLGSFFSYFLIATLVAFLVRSSNLLIVLTMLFAGHHLLPSEAIVPLVLGANLGAAAMVFTLSLKKRREARRVALVNLLVHVCGGALILVPALVLVGDHSAFLWLVEHVAPGRLLSPLPGNIEQHVATAHTTYNILLAVVFIIMPFLITRPLNRLLPNLYADEDVKPIHLDENLISSPALALRQTTAEVIYMTEICRKAVAEAFDSFRYEDLDLSEQVVRREQVLSDLHRAVSRYLVEVCENQLARRDAAQLEILQSGSESVARIGTYAEEIRELAARKIDEQIPNAEEVSRDLNEIYDLVMAQFDNILQLLDERDPRTEENAVKMVQRLAKYSSRIDAHWRQRTHEGDSASLSVTTHLQTIVYQEAFSRLFRIAAELAHVAQRMRILAPHRH